MEKKSLAYREMASACYCSSSSSAFAAASSAVALPDSSTFAVEAAKPHLAEEEPAGNLGVPKPWLKAACLMRLKVRVVAHLCRSLFVLAAVLKLSVPRTSPMRKQQQLHKCQHKRHAHWRRSCHRKSEDGKKCHFHSGSPEHLREDRTRLAQSG